MKVFFSAMLWSFLVSCIGICSLSFFSYWMDVHFSEFGRFMISIISWVVFIFGTIIIYSLHTDGEINITEIFEK